MKKTIEKQERLFPGYTYHIYNKAIGTDRLFISNKDYQYFLIKLERFISPIAEILSYCLIPNHFHLLVDIKESEEIEIKSIAYAKDPDKLISQVFSNFFNSYSKSFNKAHNRAGRLFLYPFNEYWWRMMIISFI